MLRRFLLCDNVAERNPSEHPPPGRWPEVLAVRTPIPPSMFDLYRFGNNPLDDEGISSEELGKFSTETLGRMTQDTVGGLLNGEIAATATALQNFDVTLTSETVKLGVQKARTAAKAEFRAALPDEISKLHGAVMMKFGQNAPVVAEYFPEGRDVFSQCQDNMLDNKLAALRDAFAAQETAAPGSFPAATLALANALVTTWQALFGAATTGRSQSAQTGAERRATGKALRVQLYKNILKIASLFAGQLTANGEPRGAERITFYCPQHLLENPAPSAPNPPQG